MHGLSDTWSSLFGEGALLIDGEWTQGTGASRTDVRNPATGEVIGTVPRASDADVRGAIASAHAAFQGWRRESARTRADVLRRWFGLVVEHRADLARIMTLEQGKPLREALTEIDQTAAYLEWYAEECRRLYGETVPANTSDRRLFVTREPVGVVGVITPWNFPAAMIARKVSAALAAGCTVVVKPADETPFSALALARLAEAAGVPAGVFNLVTGPGSAIGRVLTADPRVRKISFTGSTPVGKILARESADTLKSVSLELGGNAPLIVFDDADLDRAVSAALAGKFRNAGQTCVAVNRVFVQRGVADEFERRFAEASAGLQLGDGLDEGTHIGPLINEAAVQSVESVLADARARGARVLVGGSRRSGLLFEPTVVADVSDDMQLIQQEIFGPIAPITRFDTEDEVLARANATEYGLAAYFFTRDYARISRMCEGLEFGMVGVNESLVATEVAPFGGVKDSGYGREGSRHGLEDYTHLKYVCVGGL